MYDCDALDLNHFDCKPCRFDLLMSIRFLLYSDFYTPTPPLDKRQRGLILPPRLWLSHGAVAFLLGPMSPPTASKEAAHSNLPRKTHWMRRTVPIVIETSPVIAMGCVRFGQSRMIWPSLQNMRCIIGHRASYGVAPVTRARAIERAKLGLDRTG